MRADVRAGHSVLDLGCGTGNLIIEILSYQPDSIIGVDNSPSMIKTAKKKVAMHNAQNVLLIKQDILEYLASAATGSFDRIVSVNVVYALNDRHLLWQQLLRVLKPGGKITIATSVKTDSKSLISQQLKTRGWLASLHPRLLGVAVVDALINLLGHSGHFAFPNEETLKKEISTAGGTISDVAICYADVDILFDVSRT